ncbi:2Fe-2S iron-sulfur cluster-binding protein [Algoriphagus namhaensis]|uniref:2Fe-2S iron-sulfur cluster-binding protein n=1 Tax=Algoriphagus namhaensis TaxID=915353 RepID=A0ABV8ALM1_9BACT
MPEIVIENLFGYKISSTTSHRKVIDLIHENGIDWMHACGKKGRCTTCKMILVGGEENLSPINDREELFLTQGRLKSGERLSCQSTLLSGKIIIRVADRNKFPHLEYSE